MALYEAEEEMMEGTWFVSVRKAIAPMTQKYQQFLDKVTPHTAQRWYCTAFLAFVSSRPPLPCGPSPDATLSPHVAQQPPEPPLGNKVYVVRVWLIAGFYVVSYGLGIYVLNLLIPFISPQDEDALLPTAKDDEHRPFMRKMSEFKFWYQLTFCHYYMLSPYFSPRRHGCTKAFTIAIIMTFFRFFDVPVFWPILLLYFLMLFGMTMKKQISHMIQYVQQTPSLLKHDPVL